MDATKNVKFVRVHGRIVPIHGKGSAPSGASKRYGVKKQVPVVHKGSATKGAVFGAAIGASVPVVKAVAHAVVGGKGKGSFKSMGIGALVGAGIGAAFGAGSLTKRGKGESRKQLSKRVVK